MVDSKGYEREGACTLLARLGDLTGVTITFDALHACNGTLEQARFQGADVVVTIKENVSRVLAAVQRQFALASNIQSATSFDKGHGRREERRVEVIPLSPHPDLFPTVHWGMRITRNRTTIRQGHIVAESSEISYAVATHSPTHPPSIDDFMHMVRNHWAVENRLHHKKDRTMKEDRSRLRGSSARIVAGLRTLVTSLLNKIGGHLPQLMIQLAADTRRLMHMLTCKLVT